MQHPTGPETATNTLSQSEYESILCYIDLYNEICQGAGVARGKSTTDIQGQYDGECRAEDLASEYEKATTNRLRWVVRAQGNQILRLEEQLALVKKNNPG